jgi:hypothetical protein
MSALVRVRRLALRGQFRVRMENAH